MLFDHAPIGDGSTCTRCGMSYRLHRVSHVHVGDAPYCATCHLPRSHHRVKARSREETRRAYESRKRRGLKVRGGIRKKLVIKFMGIDGEGITVGKNHKYVYLACSDAHGRSWASISNPGGLGTKECLDFILNDIPHSHHRIFAYSFNYDLTKILEDVDDRSLYRLARPELRPASGKARFAQGPMPIRWQGYRLNLQAAKFTVERGNRRVVIWDIFKFFQGPFVTACADWKVGDKDRIALMREMKERRAYFNALMQDDPKMVEDYCLEECRFMATLAEKLTDAHIKAGIKLRSYYGAGSSAGAMLSKIRVPAEADNPQSELLDLKVYLKRVREKTPPELAAIFKRAFFGGRFEHSAIGPIEGPVYNFDISSAYPYQICFLPCLLHGTWDRVTDRRALEGARYGVVRYRLHKPPREKRFAAWAPFPFRIGHGPERGSIVFPSASDGGWVYLDEYLAGERLFPNIEFLESYVFRPGCECQIFASVPKYYLERLAIGKEGPGIVLKLGLNSCFGKLAQSVGAIPYNSWAWAGMITSGCRAQALDALGQHADWQNLLMIATDGIYTREDLKLAEPRDTGTAIHVTVSLTGEKKYAPLGGWERKEVPQGVFLARPGVYFPLNPTDEELKQIRARGIGKSVLYKSWYKIVAHYEKYDWAGWERPDDEADWNDKRTCLVENLPRFCGMKSSIIRSGKPGAYKYTRSDGKLTKRQRIALGLGIEHEPPRYGAWITRPVEMSFDPMPKRRRVGRDGVTLTLRDLTGAGESAPYVKGVLDDDARELRAAADEALEQPEGSLEDTG